MNAAGFGVETMDQAGKIDGNQQIVLDRYIAHRAMKLLLEIELAVGVAVLLCVFPNEAGIRISDGPLAFAFIKLPVATNRNRLTRTVNCHFATDVAGFRRIDADQTSRSLAMLRLLAAGDIDIAPVVNRRTEERISRAATANIMARHLEVDVEFPNQ